MSALRVGIIGFGYASRTFHVPLVMATEGLSLVAVSSRHPDEVKAALPDIECVASADDLLAIPDLDVVIIPTPNDTHFPLAKRAIENGLHVVVDKPFTLTTAQARELSNLAREKQVVLSVFHNRRWDGDFMTLKQVIGSGCLGDITSVEIRYDRYRPEVRQRWREQNIPGGGLWFDLGPHLLDQAVQLFGMPESIQADIAVLRPSALSDDYAHASLFYPWGRIVLNASMLVATETPHYVVNGTNGGYIKYGLDVQEEQLKQGMQPGEAGWGVDDRDGYLLTRNTQGELDQIRYDALPGDYRCYYSMLRDAIQGKGPNPVTSEEAANIIYLIEMGSMSSRQGQRLAIGSAQ